MKAILDTYPPFLGNGGGNGKCKFANSRGVSNIKIDCKITDR